MYWVCSFDTRTKPTSHALRQRHHTLGEMRRLARFKRNSVWTELRESGAKSRARERTTSS
jgi:hypothetical protein